jgi:spermidine synthase
MGAIPAGHKGIIYLIFSLSGFCALIYEILWTKHLSLTFGTTMIAVSIVAAVFMAGLALGSYLLGKYSDHETNLLRIYAFLELGIAIFALLFPPTLRLSRLPAISRKQTKTPSTTPRSPCWCRTGGTCC